MDLNTQITDIVDGIVKQVEAGVAKKVDQLIADSIKARLSTFNFTDAIQKAATEALDRKASSIMLIAKNLKHVFLTGSTRLLRKYKNKQIKLLKKQWLNVSKK